MGLELDLVCRQDNGMTEARERKFTMLLSEKERVMLTELAEADGLSAAMYLRRIIHVNHKKLRYDLDMVAGASVD